jgi:hypothetical protein
MITIICCYINIFEILAFIRENSIEQNEIIDIIIIIIID